MTGNGDLIVIGFFVVLQNVSIFCFLFAVVKRIEVVEYLQLLKSVPFTYNCNVIATVSSILVFALSHEQKYEVELILGFLIVP